MLTLVSPAEYSRPIFEVREERNSPHSSSPLSMKEAKRRLDAGGERRVGRGWARDGTPEWVDNSHREEEKEDTTEEERGGSENGETEEEVLVPV